MAAPALEYFEDDGQFPNSRLPVLIYKRALAEPSAEAVEALFQRNGWPPAWRSTVFTYHHYHSTAHEVLGIASGEGRLMLGGPLGRAFDVSAGDVIVIPAGVAHQRLSSSLAWLVVGGYPPGQSWDLLRGDPADRIFADRAISKVPLPLTDPVEGEGGALLQHWH